MQRRPALLFCAILFSLAAHSQFRVEKFIEVEAYHKSALTSIFAIRWVPGNQDSLFLFKDTNIISHLKKLNDFRSIPDALNFLGGQGWKFVAVNNTVNGGTIQFFFKKEFDQDELR